MHLRFRFFALSLYLVNVVSLPGSNAAEISNIKDSSVDCWEALHQCATSTYHAHCEKIIVFVCLLFWIQQHAVCLPPLQSQMFDPLRTHWRAKCLFTKTIKCHKNVMDYLSKAILGLCFHIALKELRPTAAWKVENRCKSMLLKVVRNNEPLVCRTMAGQ